MIAWLAVSARAGEASGELAVDVLHAGSTSEAEGSGPEPGLSATELGLRLRGDVEQGRWSADLDVQDREALAGDTPTLTHRLVYRAEVTLGLVEDRLALGVGRFLAPSATFLAVDGARLTWTPGDLGTFVLFGGRRGIAAARTNLGFDTMLPVVGGAGAWRDDRFGVDASASWAGDQVSYGTEGVVPGTDGATVTATTAGLAASAGGVVEPIDDLLVVGARGTLTQDGTWLLDPGSPAAPELVMTSVDLYQAQLYGRWRFNDAIRLDGDLLNQAARVPIAVGDLVDPTFTDLRARGAVRVRDAAWLRPDVRLRFRTDRTELRYGLGADVDRLFVPGPFLRARAWIDDVWAGGTADDGGAVDRLLWSASGGWSRAGFEVEAGASFVERAVGPVSGRTASSTTSDDLSPFVLEAQNVAFLRSFVASRRWFAGADLEANVLDTPEVRAFLQVGLLGDTSW